MISYISHAISRLLFDESKIAIIFLISLVGICFPLFIDVDLVPAGGEVSLLKVIHSSEPVRFVYNAVLITCLVLLLDLLLDHYAVYCRSLTHVPGATRGDGYKELLIFERYAWLVALGTSRFHAL